MIIYKKIGNYTDPKKTAYVQKKGKTFFLNGVSFMNIIRINEIKSNPVLLGIVTISIRLFYIRIIMKNW